MPAVGPELVGARDLELGGGHPENVAVTVDCQLDVSVNVTAHTANRSSKGGAFYEWHYWELRQSISIRNTEEAV